MTRETTPEPAVVEDEYLVSNRERVEERAHAADKATERALDASSDKAERMARLALEERMAAQEARLAALTSAMKQQGRPVGNIAVAGPHASETMAEITKKMLEGKSSVQILIHSDPRDLGNNRPVDVNVNGRVWKLPRGVPVEVPTFVVEVLAHAEVNGVQQIVDADGYPHMVHVVYQRYPFTVIG
jgi:hypothetical protein